jgi:hypothetical protein
MRDGIRSCLVVRILIIRTLIVGISDKSTLRFGTSILIKPRYPYTLPAVLPPSQENMRILVQRH